jgi:pantothenate kinase
MGADEIDLAALVQRVDRLVGENPDKRVLIGIVGAPGSGKTTLAQALVAELLTHTAPWTAGTVSDHRDAGRPWIGSHVAHVPMDGYHLADVELHRLGRAGRKGAPDTFDAGGYTALLRRLLAADSDVWAPAFDRELEQPVAGSIPVLRSTRVVITEGNYLLRPEPEWADIQGLLTEVWFCDLAQSVRLERLVARHVRFGKSPVAAREWSLGPDQRNADLILATRDSADLVLTGDVPLPPVDGGSSAGSPERSGYHRFG